MLASRPALSQPAPGLNAHPELITTDTGNEVYFCKKHHGSFAHSFQQGKADQKQGSSGPAFESRSGSKRTVSDFSRYRTGCSYAQIINLFKFNQNESIFILMVKAT
jgi:hypothetical protein